MRHRKCESAGTRYLTSALACVGQRVGENDCKNEKAGKCTERRAESIRVLSAVELKRRSIGAHDCEYAENGYLQMAKVLMQRIAKARDYGI